MDELLGGVPRTPLMNGVPMKLFGLLVQTTPESVSDTTDTLSLSVSCSLTQILAVSLPLSCPLPVVPIWDVDGINDV